MRVRKEALTEAIDDLATVQTDDQFVAAIGKQLDQCCDELGMVGCARCPVSVECRQLWRQIEDRNSRSLTVTEYRQYSLRFHVLKGKRNALARHSVSSR